MEPIKVKAFDIEWGGMVTTEMDEIGRRRRRSEVVWEEVKSSGTSSVVAGVEKLTLRELSSRQLVLVGAKICYSRWVGSSMNPLP